MCPPSLPSILQETHTSWRKRLAFSHYINYDHTHHTTHWYIHYTEKIIMNARITAYDMYFFYRHLVVYIFQYILHLVHKSRKQALSSYSTLAYFNKQHATAI